MVLIRLPQLQYDKNSARITVLSIVSDKKTDVRILGRVVRSKNVNTDRHSSTRFRGSGAADLDGGWKLYYSGVVDSRVKVLTSCRRLDYSVEWIPLSGRVYFLNL